MKMILMLCSAFIFSTAYAEKRMAIVVGANPGWASDRPLQYAHQDARRMAEVLKQFGGFEEKNVLLLENPSADELRRHFRALGYLKKEETEKALFFFYYSGHADANFLHLSGNAMRLTELFDELRGLSHQVKLAVLDACQSGSIVQTKGGKPTQVFEVQFQNELNAKGLAVLTSSGADEFSQEKRDLRGSVFTHHLVSGLRGAADENGDRKVTVSEAYRHASERTYLDTVASPVGPQRPTFKFDLAGHEDVVITLLEKKSGWIQFPKSANNCFLTDENSRFMVAEIQANKERDSNIVVTPGKYWVKCRREGDLGVAMIRVEPKKATLIAQVKWTSVPLSQGVLKGTVEDESLRLRKQAYYALEIGDYDKAAELFDLILSGNFGDFHAFRGKAQALLMRSRERSDKGDKQAASTDFMDALRAEPALGNDPFVERRRVLALPIEPNSQEKLDSKAPTSPVAPVTPMKKKTSDTDFGAGISIIDAHGVFNLSLRYRLMKSFETALYVDVVDPGAGASFRYWGRDNLGGLFFGAGGHVSLAGLGLRKREIEREVRFGGNTLARSSMFDRQIHLDAGVTLDLDPFFLDVGVAGLYAMPIQGNAGFFVLPVVTGKVFF